MGGGRVDRATMEGILLEHAPALRAFVAARIPQRFRGEFGPDDVLQEIWLSVFRTDWGTIHSAEAWLYQIARRRLEDACRQARAKKRGGDQTRLVNSTSQPIFDAVFGGEQPPGAKSPSQVVMTAELIARLNDALKMLDERTRQALELHYQRGMPRSEVAEEMGVTESTANTLIYRGVQQLRDLLPGQSSRRIGA